MGMRMPETCWAVFKWQVINPRNYCIWLVDSFEFTRFFSGKIFRDKWNWQCLRGAISMILHVKFTYGCNAVINKILFEEFFNYLEHTEKSINPLNPELNPICYLLALLGAHHFLHVSRIRGKLLTFRRLMSYIYIYGAPILDVFRSHTTTQHSR